MYLLFKSQNNNNMLLRQKILRHSLNIQELQWEQSYSSKVLPFLANVKKWLELWSLRRQNDFGCGTSPTKNEYHWVDSTWESNISCVKLMGKDLGPFHLLLSLDSYSPPIISMHIEYHSIRYWKFLYLIVKPINSSFLTQF